MFKSIFSKKLPGALDSQPKTIFVVSAHTIARIFIIENDDMHELTPLHTDTTNFNYTDEEGFVYTNEESHGSMGTNTGFSEKNRMHFDHVFAKFMVKEIEKLDKEYKAEKIIIYVPEDVKEILTELFPKTYTDKIHIHIGNHIKTSFSKLIELLK